MPADAMPADAMPADAMPADAMPADAGLEPVLISVMPMSAQLNVGETVDLTATLDSPAPMGGTVLMLMSDDIVVATVDPSVTVPEGMLSMNFTVTAQSPGTTTVTVTLGADALTSSISVSSMSAGVDDVIINEFRRSDPWTAIPENSPNWSTASPSSRGSSPGRI
jgi:hypothetical protein